MISRIKFKTERVRNPTFIVWHLELPPYQHETREFTINPFKSEKVEKPIKKVTEKKVNVKPEKKVDVNKVEKKKDESEKR